MKRLKYQLTIDYPPNLQLNAKIPLINSQTLKVKPHIHIIKFHRNLVKLVENY